MRLIIKIIIALFLLMLAIPAFASQGYSVIPNTGTLSGLALVNTANSNLDALLSTNIGTTRPSYAESGTLWDDSTNTQIKHFDGTADEPIGFYSTIGTQFSSPIFRLANSSTGTAANKIIKLTGAPSTGVTIGTADSTGFVGIAVTGIGTSGANAYAHLVTHGYVQCVFDGATTAGDYVQSSTTVAGDCHDASSTYPTSGQILGRVLSTNGSGGTYGIWEYPNEIRGSSGGGGSGTVASSTTGQVAVYTGATTVTGGANFTATAGALTLGVSGTAGSVKMGNATSGTITLQPVTGALGTVTVSLPAATDTLVGKATTDTFTNKTYDTAGTGNSFSVNSVALTGNSGTGNMVRVTGATLVTPTLGAASATSLAASGNITTSAGSVGIGTTSPQTLLHVHGGAILSDPSTLTISTSTFTPVAVGANTFRVVLIHASCPCTIASPSGTAQDGTRILVEVWQSATGSDTVTWTTGSGGSYDFGTAGAPTLSTAANKGDGIGFSYSAQNSRWNYIGVQQGW